MRDFVRRLTVEEYQRIVKAGILQPEDNVELLRGLIVCKDRGLVGQTGRAHDPLHLLIVSKLVKLAGRVNCDRWHLLRAIAVGMSTGQCAGTGYGHPGGG
jgi:hypothetical protein